MSGRDSVRNRGALRQMGLVTRLRRFMTIGKVPWGLSPPPGGRWYSNPVELVILLLGAFGLALANGLKAAERVRATFQIAVLYHWRGSMTRKKRSG